MGTPARYTIGFYVDSVPFTRGVIDGSESLGGSESACLGLARALRGRGHDVHILATKLDPACEGADHAGVVWHAAEGCQELLRFIEWDVFVVLRMFDAFAKFTFRARLRLLWNQDLLSQPKFLMATAYAVDRMVYVSDYQRRQFEDQLPELKGLAYVTRNGYDPALVPPAATKDPNRLIHISRPERGLRPLLTMWPELRRRRPDATLRLCRYNSMYDAQGWGRICASYDRAVAEVNDQVGGITYLGELGKPQLYKEIADAAGMWYPGVHDFAETSCIAAVEAQACGTPFVGSYKGALPETVPGGALIRGNAETPEYQSASLHAIEELLDGCHRSGRAYRDVQATGRAHIRRYTYAAIAAEWEAWLGDTFRTRYQAQTLGVVRQFLHDDDHVAARAVTEELLCRPNLTPETQTEAEAAFALCESVMAGEGQTAEEYGTNALDTEAELQVEGRLGGRMFECLGHFQDRSHVLDVACGNGSFAVLLALTYPSIRVTGIDFSTLNIERATAAAVRLGVADRCTFVCAPFWNFATQAPTGALQLEARCDGAFVGEFLEHIANAAGLIDTIETFLTPGAPVVFTTPHGPFSELLERQKRGRRSHVHQFCHDDLTQVFGLKQELALRYLPVGQGPRGAEVGHWIISYQTGGGPARPRNLAHRSRTCRPLQRLSIGLLCGADELDLARCLDSIYGIADEIVIGDTGMGAFERAVATDYGARLISVGRITDLAGGFAEARNRVLDACTGEWHLMVDADERLVSGLQLRKYCETGPYTGYAIKQIHLMLDVAQNHDTPVRLFRRDRPIRYYGCVHEQPQLTDQDTDVTPALEVHDVEIAHTGYLHESVRREKMVTRNWQLLNRSVQVFGRQLDYLLILRDRVNLADYLREQAGGQLPPRARASLQQAVVEFEARFADPAHKYHGLARPWYERALQELGLGLQIEYSLAGKVGGLKQQHAKPKRLWVRTHADLERTLQHELAQIKEQLTPAPLKVDPFETEEAA